MVRRAIVEVTRPHLQEAERLLGAVLGEHGGKCRCTRCLRVDIVHSWLGRVLKEKPA